MKRVSLFVFLAIACRRDVVEQASPPQSPQPEIRQQQQQQQALPRVAGPTLPFVDEATSDPTLVAYRNELLAAVRSRDLEALMKLVDPKIRTSFGGGGGAEDFRRMFDDPKMWADLEQILTLGGTFLDAGDGKAFWAPYVYSTWPEASDAFTSSAVIADDVPLLDQPNGKPIATLSRNIVERVEAPGSLPGEWTQVKTTDGRTGYVASKSLRSPVAYRAGFNKEAERWRMTGLVAGD